MVAPHIDAFAREHTGRVKVGKLNIQQSPELASRFNILSVPYLLIFDRGNLMESLPGAMDKRQIQQLAARYFY
jgi:thioredoxin 1